MNDLSGIVVFVVSHGGVEHSGIRIILFNPRVSTHFVLYMLIVTGLENFDATIRMNTIPLERM